MRNPERIDKILDRVRVIWKANPDLRLGQLLSNISPRLERNPFYFEDVDFEHDLSWWEKYANR